MRAADRARSALCVTVSVWKNSDYAEVVHC